jgi:multidrug efflux pump
MRFTDIFIRRPVLSMVISLLIFLVGIRAFTLLNVREYPKMSNAQVTVTTLYPGASADVVRGFITTPLESVIAEAQGIDYLQSVSVESTSLITANLVLGYDPTKALTEITSKVNSVRNQLPAAAEVPTLDIKVGQTTDDMYLGFYSDVLKANQITDYLLRVVQPRLATIEGVQKAEVLGAHRFAVRVWLKPDRMAALGVAPADVRTVLAANNFLAAAGQTKGALTSVNFVASTDLHSIQGFRDLIVKRVGNTIVHLSQIADVELGAESYDTDVQFNGKSATFIGIQSAPDANSLDVIKRVRAALPDIEARLPPGMQMDVPYDATKYITDSIDEVVKTLAETLAIVIVVIFLFMGSFRAVSVPVVAMPLSLVGVGIVMLVMGYSINLMTLLAIVLAIGLVVDDAIIVVENVERHIRQGASPFNAAIQGARELGFPVIAMSITLVAVYAPIGLMGGLTGNLFSEFAFTLAGTVIISGIVALTLSPMMSARFLRAQERGRFVLFLDRSFERLRGRYERLLHGSLDYRPVTYVFALAVLTSCYFLFQNTQRELAPTEDQGLILAKADAAANANLDQTMKYTAQITTAFQSFPETGAMFQLNGAGGGGAAATGNSAIAGLVLKPWSERSRSQMQLLPLVQQKLSGISGLQAAAFAMPPLPGAASGLPVQFVIGTTEDELSLNGVAQQLLARARSSGLFMFANTDLKIDKPVTHIVIDRAKAALLGLDMSEVGSDLSVMLGGNYVNFFSMQGRSYKVIPQVQRVSRLTPGQIRNYYIRASNGAMVPLSTIVRLESDVVPEQISRFQQLNAATISAVPMPGVSQGDALDYLQAQAAQILPRGYSIDYAGESRQYVQAGSSLVLTFFFAIVIIFLVLAAQFESFRDPLITLISVPMSISGALIFLTIGLATVNIYTEIGLITLIGLISKHGILIVQFANQLQIEEGIDKRAAIERAASVRLRPILMTTAAMVVGVIPLILATGAGAISRFDMGLVIATGMTIGTLFTLFVVPAMYMLLAIDHGAVRAAERPSVG